MFFQHQPDGSRRHSLSQFTEEQRTGLYVRFKPVLLDCLQRNLSHRNDSFFPAFSKNAHGFAECIDIGDIQSGQFAQTQTAAVEKLHHCGVARRGPDWSLSLGAQPSSAPSTVHPPVRPKERSGVFSPSLAVALLLTDCREILLVRPDICRSCAVRQR